jgi:hypothetical protein
MRGDYALIREPGDGIRGPGVIGDPGSGDRG